MLLIYYILYIGGGMRRSQRCHNRPSAIIGLVIGVELCVYFRPTSLNRVERVWERYLSCSVVFLWLSGVSQVELCPHCVTVWKHRLAPLIHIERELCHYKRQTASVARNIFFVLAVLFSTCITVSSCCYLLWRVWRVDTIHALFSFTLFWFILVSLISFK